MGRHAGFHPHRRSATSFLIGVERTAACRILAASFSLLFQRTVTSSVCTCLPRPANARSGFAFSLATPAFKNLALSLLRPFQLSSQLSTAISILHSPVSLTSSNKPPTYRSTMTGSQSPEDPAARRGRDQYFCYNGQHHCRREDFTASQLLKYGGGVGRHSRMSCHKHTSGAATELKCLGYCARVLPVSRFSKMQRSSKGRQHCMECIDYQLSLEPGRRALPPPGKHQREFQEDITKDQQLAIPWIDDDASTEGGTTSAASSVDRADHDDNITILSQATSSATRNPKWVKASQRKTQFLTPAYLGNDPDDDDEAYYTDGSQDEC
ncbi:hypothetical protein MAPG_08639 [Magnaporthiopsis poae ATCC 64411]|uniref:Stc1 domain-containing protein n=1 Tax=Magnaporthiopsis poae (strain ATCC 64411 / 73-15) TaxID=644358 RepID=A0A0C4E7W3_MAGP6|nr:hypothetical protein MAPG_08639 [Magnaporthiopsis poae ATCC 64411]